MWASIIPGNRCKPDASTISAAERSNFDLIATIRPSTTATSAENSLSDVTTVPLQNKTSYKLISTPKNLGIPPSPEAQHKCLLMKQTRPGDDSVHRGSAQITSRPERA